MAVNISITEVAGRIDRDGQLFVNEALPIEGPVKVWIVSEQDGNGAEEHHWLASLARNPTFADLHEADEDLYTLNDGRPFQH